MTTIPPFLSDQIKDLFDGDFVLVISALITVVIAIVNIIENGKKLIRLIKERKKSYE